MDTRCRFGLIKRKVPSIGRQRKATFYNLSPKLFENAPQVVGGEKAIFMTIRQRFMKAPQVVGGENARFTTKIEKYFFLSLLLDKNRGGYRNEIENLYKKEKAAFNDCESGST